MGISDHADLGERDGQSNIMAIGRAGAGAPGMMKDAPKGGGDSGGAGGGGKEKGGEGKEKEKPKPPRYY